MVAMTFVPGSSTDLVLDVCETFAGRWWTAELMADKIGEIRGVPPKIDTVRNIMYRLVKQGSLVSSTVQLMKYGGDGVPRVVDALAVQWKEA